VKDVAIMIYAGVFFFFLAIASGVCGFSGMLGTVGAHVAQTVFFSSQVLASLTFAWPLVHTGAASFEQSADGVGETRLSSATSPAVSAFASTDVCRGHGSGEATLFEEALHPLGLAAPSL
jgi:uncharacterized membrane protein YtjA (UPF0391 family)